MLSKQLILTALNVWIRQRPGLEFGNYGAVAPYRAELRQITKDLHDAERLLNAVALRDSITQDDLLKAFPRAYSGRLSITETKDGRAKLEYCTGQYWPTEYRKAVCAVLSAALWEQKRADMPRASGTMKRTVGKGAFAMETECDNIEGMAPGDWIRNSFRREFGRSIQQRWFS